MIGNKYLSKINGNIAKEYNAWSGMLARCFSKKKKDEHKTYQDVTCCEEWLLYDNFYEWLHSQDNFDKWLNNDGWHLDKDILIKGNKIYSPETCCLVPMNVNLLFVRNETTRGKLPIGVCKNRNWFSSCCNNPITNKYEYYGLYNTKEEAFLEYKKHKEDIIKQVAGLEYNKSNITEQCYNAMMNYVVEIND